MRKGATEEEALIGRALSGIETTSRPHNQPPIKETQEDK